MTQIDTIPPTGWSDKAPALPQQPPLGLLVSMAMRYDHGLGMPGYYDSLASLGLGWKGVAHKQRLLGTLATMRQLYEEVSGHGFYRPELEASYASRADAAGLGALNKPELTHEALQLAVEACALEVCDMASDHGCIVTVEHVRSPDASPGIYHVAVRPTRAHYPKQGPAGTSSQVPAVETEVVTLRMPTADAQWLESLDAASIERILRAGITGTQLRPGLGIWSEKQRQAVGEALTNKLAEMCEGEGSPDWFDARHVDEVLDVIEAQLLPQLVASDDHENSPEAVVACLGDDAAALRHENPEDERAANMETAARLIRAAYGVPA